MRSGKSLEQSAASLVAHFDIPFSIAARDVERIWSEWETSILAPASLSVPVPLPHPPQRYPDTFARTIRVHGKGIRIILHDADLVAEIAPRLEPLLISSNSEPEATLQVAASENRFHIFSGEICVATLDHPVDARVVLLQELVRAAQGNVEWAAILHAGAVGLDSKCVIFPAATHSGKTTLAAVLMQQGLTLYADDSVVLERETLTVPAMPFPLMIREGSWPVISKSFAEFKDLPVHNRYGQNVKFLGPPRQAAETNARAVAIAFAKWKPDATTTINSLDSFDALVRLHDSGFWVAHDRVSIQRFLDWIQSLPIYEISYSDVDEAAAFIRDLVSGIMSSESKV